jgi:thioesterase domain-containing protein
VQPHGPYYLVSWSYGGIVAFEMALQLQRAGETVAFVGELDTKAPALLRDEPLLPDEEVLVRLAEEAAEDVRRTFSMRWEELRGLPFDEQVRCVADALHAQGGAPSNFSAATLRESFEAVRARERSTSAYVPGRFAGTVTLFRAAEVAEHAAAFLATRTDEERHTLGWHLHATGPVEVVQVPGSHITLASEPHVRVLAQRMRDSVASARERAESVSAPRAESASAPRAESASAPHEEAAV